jgi:hypothetical protein
VGSTLKALQKQRVFRTCLGQFSPHPSLLKCILIYRKATMQEPTIRKVILDALNNPKPHFHPMFRFALHPIIFWPRTPEQPRRRCGHLMRALRNRHR